MRIDAGRGNREVFFNKGPSKVKLYPKGTVLVGAGWGKLKSFRVKKIREVCYSRPE